MISTSSGRCFSKAAISGALQEVWPPTMAPCFVAMESFVSTSLHIAEVRSQHTRTILGSNLVNRSSLHVVDDIITGSRDEMSIWEYLDSFLWISQPWCRITMYKGIYLLFLQTPRTNSGISLLYRMR